MTIPSFPIVGIGASAGGLKAFTQILEYLPATTGMAYVCVQHLAPTHDSLLSALLARVTKMPVHEIREDMIVEPDHVYVLSPGTDLTIENGVLKPEPRTQTDGLHLPIDSFFRSLAAQQKRQAIGVVLSGTASDGTLGLKAIKAEGGITFAQDATAQYQGMPQSALAAGYVDALLPPEGIAKELLRISQHSYVKPSHAAEPEVESVEREQEFPDDEQSFQQILLHLRQSTGVNFAAYKPTTVKRRIMRRLALQKKESVAEYAAFLRDNPLEVEALYQDMLINVTSFFRDPLAFQAVTHEVFPALLKTKASGDALRVWVAGCSTGEEVYSLAICLLEYCASQSITPLIQIFGTDIDDTAIKHARTGSYLPSAVEGVSPERLQHFFQRVDGSYHINKSVRDLCVFARHNVCTDPPFSRVDLLSCRNLLIYLGPALQKKVMHTFQYALKPHGFLLLGSSENVGADSPLFAPVDKKQKVYTKKATSVRPAFDVAMLRGGGEQRDLGKEERMMHEGDAKDGDAQKEADSLLLANYVPASVVIDAAMEVQHFRGHTSPYLEPASGKASFNLFKMAREGLMLPLRTAIHQAHKSGQRVKKEGIELLSHGTMREVTVEVLPLKGAPMERSFLVLFEDVSLPSPQAAPSPMSGKRETGTGTPDAKDRRITQLEQELAATREDMRSVVEELEAANEELQSANEEILSSNEELQSINEELETSKEEIQSANEELTIVNQELRIANEQLKAARDFADAIVETVREPLMILNANLGVLRANRSFYSTFQVTREETEQHYLYDLGNGQWNIPTLRTLLVETLPENHSFQGFEVKHTFPAIGSKTMLLNARQITGADGRGPRLLLALEDITERKELEQQKDDFLGIVSHELKTPVTSIKAYTQALHRRFVKAGDERSATQLAKMDAQLNKLTRLISDLLDVTKIEAGKLSAHDEAFVIEDLVQDIVEELQRTTETHHIRIEGAVTTQMYGDRERIGQVLTNILSNAIKYSPSADTVLVKTDADADSVTVRIQDFGTGIATDKLASVFDRFFRVSSPELETFPGLGLGLYISAEIIKRQGGRMWVESSPGTGSIFCFTVPIRRAPRSAAKQEKETDHA